MAGVGLELEKVGDEERAQKKHTVADFRRWCSLITTYNHMNFPTAADEVETLKFQLSIVYHLLLFSVGVRWLPRSRFLANAMLSKDSTRTELGKRPIPTRRVGEDFNTIICRRSLLSRKPNSYHRGNGKDKHEDNLVAIPCCFSVTLATSRWPRARAETDIARPDQGCVASPPPLFFHYPLQPRRRHWRRERRGGPAFGSGEASAAFASSLSLDDAVDIGERSKNVTEMDSVSGKTVRMVGLGEGVGGDAAPIRRKIPPTFRSGNRYRPRTAQPGANTRGTSPPTASNCSKLHCRRQPGCWTVDRVYSLSFLFVCRCLIVKATKTSSNVDGNFAVSQLKLSGETSKHSHAENDRPTTKLARSRVGKRELVLSLYWPAWKRNSSFQHCSCRHEETTSKARDERRSGRAVFLYPGPGIDLTKSLVMALCRRLYCEFWLKKKLALIFGIFSYTTVWMATVPSNPFISLPRTLFGSQPNKMVAISCLFALDVEPKKVFSSAALQPCVHVPH